MSRTARSRVTLYPNLLNWEARNLVEGVKPRYKVPLRAQLAVLNAKQKYEEDGTIHGAVVAKPENKVSPDAEDGTQL